VSSVPTPLLVVPTGAANLAAVFACFRRFGAEPVLSSHPERIATAERVILPGVGAFGPARTALAESGADAALVARIEADRPTLGICLGMHLLSEGSDEAPGDDAGCGGGGLAVLPGRATRFTGDVRIPQMGWNRVSAPGSGMLTTGDAYFANSFRIAVPEQPDRWTMATTDHGGPFLSAAERGRTLVCQFHPELSGRWGAALMERWYEGGAC